jgi:hypothetical protein
MGPDELALLQVLLQSGYTEEQAMQMLSSGALTAPGVAPPAVQQAMGANTITPQPAQQSWAHPTYMPHPSDLRRSMQYGQDFSGGNNPGLSNNYADPTTPVDPYNSGMQYANAPMFEDGGSLQFGADGADGWYMGGGPPPNPIHSYASEYYPMNPGGGGRGVPVGGVNPNAYMEKERSYGGDARDVQTYGRDFSGDLGAIIRELVNAGRSAAAAQRPSAQRNPSRPSSPGRSASAPGQMKKAAGVQSAKSFTPSATRATTTPTKARTVAPPAPAKVPPKPLIKSVAPTRGTAVNTLTKAKSRF